MAEAVSVRFRVSRLSLVGTCALLVRGGYVGASHHPLPYDDALVECHAMSNWGLPAEEGQLQPMTFIISLSSVFFFFSFLFPFHFLASFWFFSLSFLSPFLG